MRFHGPGRIVADCAGAVACVAGLVVLLNTLASVLDIARLPGPLIGDLVYASVITVLLALALLFRAPDGGRASIVTSETAGGMLARVLLPSTVAIPIFIEWMRAAVESHRLVDARAGSFVTLFATSAFASCIVVVVAWRLEEQERRIRASRESSFLTLLSHELRTPLVAIRNLGEIVEARWDELTAEQKRHAVGTIADQASRTLDLVGSMTLVSRIEAGTLDASPVPVPVRSGIEAALQALGSTDDVDVECPQGLMAHADPLLLKRMVEAYVVNALTHGAQPVRVIARQAGEQVEVRVEDAGAGIPAGQEEQLFTRFAQVRGGSTRRGSGLGLWLVGELARLSGGEASWSARDGGGSAFRFTVPGARARR
jgi:signal transduction histidine kinase